MPTGKEKSWTTRPAVPQSWVWALAACLVLGVSVFLAGLQVDPMRAWQAYLINFLFWGGMAQGAVVFAAIYHVVGGRWGATVRRAAEGMAAFLPASLLSFLPLYLGLEKFFGPAMYVHSARGAWLDPRFIFVRGGLGLGLLIVLSVLFVYYSLRPEVGWALTEGLQQRRRFYSWMVEGWLGQEMEEQRCLRGMDVLAPGVLLAYPITYTFMAFDLIMALDPIWYSSLFGGYFFISTFYLGLAGLAVIVVLIRHRLGPTVITPAQLSDLGRLLLGFDLTYLAMAWSQYIVIWYGNLPEETHFVILRLWEKPWLFFSWGGLALSVFIPFIIFLSQRVKRLPWVLLSVGILIAIGLWLERYVLIVPSLWTRETAPLGWIEAGITLGYLAGWGLSEIFFLRHFPIIPFAQSLPSAVLEKRDVERTA